MTIVNESLKRFVRRDETTEGAAHSKRLESFMKALWDALVPRSGECVSVQGELVRASVRLQADLYGEGFESYYARYEAKDTARDNAYFSMLAFMLDTLLANRGQALDASDAVHLKSIRDGLEQDWQRGTRLLELRANETEVELTNAERQQAERLEAARPHWEEILEHTERCVANFCIANPELIDRSGKPCEERGMRDVRHVFSPPPPPPACPHCNGKGWLPARDASAFPTVCGCRSASPVAG